MTDIRFYGLSCARCKNMTTDAQTGQQLFPDDPDGWLVGFCSMHGCRLLASETCRSPHD